MINWYPGHMAKTKRLIKENLNLIDIVYEVIDSRVPISSYIKDLDYLIDKKPKILIFAKYDLCDQKVTDKFIEYYKDMGYHILKYDLNHTNSFNDLYDLTNKVLKEKLEKEKSKGIRLRNMRALIVGVPNAGKSTLINKIAGKKATATGNKPGVTKSISWIRAGKNIELLDTPGILWPRFDNETTGYNLASTTAIKEEILPLEDVAIYIIKFLQKNYENKLEDFYQIEKSDDMENVFDQIAKRRGCLMKGGVPDYDKVITIIINDVKSGKIKNITFDRQINE